MRKTRALGQFVLIGFFVVAMTGCLSVEVIDNVRNPEAYFREAHREIARIQRHRRYKRHAEKIHILVYEKEERKIVKISTSVFLVDENTDLEHWIEEGKDEFDLKIRVDFNRRKFRNLRHKRPGFLAEIKDRGSKVLVWLD